MFLLKYNQFSINNQALFTNTINSTVPMDNCNNMTTCSNGSNSACSSSSSSTCKVTIPKAPKPQRTLIIFETVINGLSLCINDLKAKVIDLTTAVTNGYNAMAKVKYTFQH